MKVEQIHKLVNTIASEITGKTDLVQQDLSNVVDVGKEIFDVTNVDNYVKTLINHIGKVIFVNRPYDGNAPSVMMDGWEYGSVLEKIKADLPDAEENKSWDLVDGQSYDPNVFRKPVVSVKFFNSKTTFEVDMSLPDLQVKESFSSAEQLNGFLSMLSNEVEKVLTIAYDGLIKSTINSMIADTITDATTTGSTSRAVNLLALYQEETGSTLNDATRAVKDPEFIRFAVLKMKLMQSRLSNASRVFNMGGKVRFTTSEYLHHIMLADFKSAADVYLQSDTYNKELTELPNAETVPYWQGSGLDYGFNSTSKINVVSGNGNEVEQTGILAVMFDRDALGVTNLDRRVTTHYNPKAEFVNFFYKADAGYFNDGDENFVVFYVEAVAAP